MCAALKRRGVGSGKIFCIKAPNTVFGAVTANEPCGKVSWDHHVAAIVNVEGAEFVLDPALSSVPLTIAGWRAKILGGQRARIVVTPAHVYGLDLPDRAGMWSLHFDSRGAKTEEELATFRENLSVYAHRFGAPPYIPSIPSACT